ncbi:helix-turn-helix domain-containing protein [Alkalihalobacterium bogoriense]|uniref:helix-turn-helix domain-containing protein n=1 Tax=Alkalihalobacterium bogoriense TaxID=246272 RepID=UPI000688C496|nr:helix-turn-helix transcriptional regulator [Alkalihalobacterium bogoriense]
MKQKQERRKLNDNFGKLLKKLRLEKGYSLQQLAELSNVTPSYINRLERGLRKRPSIPLMMQLAEALKVDISVLIRTEVKKECGITLEELFFTNEIIYQGKALTSDTKEALLSIVETVLNSKWTSETMLNDLKIIGEEITELKEIM